MDKLELKHIAPYLPYGLEGKYTLSNVINLSVNQKDEVRDKLLAIDCVPFFLSYCKPIFRPLSDLIKPILNAGLYKIPMVELKNGGTDINTVRFFDGNYSVIDNEEHETIYSPLDMSFYQRYRGDSRQCVGQYTKFQKLLEWHFDIFGLIPAGLAIDINTLKNEK